jgi:hypothetical protein
VKVYEYTIPRESESQYKEFVSYDDFSANTNHEEIGSQLEKLLAAIMLHLTIPCAISHPRESESDSDAKK